MPRTEIEKVWTVAEAKARLSEVLRLASEKGPQTIGTKNAYVVVPAGEWRALTEKKPARPTLGRWLVANIPAETDLPLPDRREPERMIPFQEDRSE